MADEIPELLVPDADGWRTWLAAHHGETTGVKLVLARKNKVGPTSLTYDQALDEALSQGWIDGQANRRDDATYTQRFTPRRAHSPWSARNVGHIERLQAEGRMCPGGEAEVERARADGRWDRAYDGSATIAVPDDLTAALAADPAAAATWERLTSQNRYAILYRLQDAKRPATRTARLEKFVAMLARGETLHPQRH